MFTQLATAQRPLLMGVLNATPDSFSDAGKWKTHHERVERAQQLAAAGADIIDIGGESAVTDKPAVSVDEEIGRVVELVEAVGSCCAGITISVDTYKPKVAELAIAAGAKIVNDISGLADPEMATLCAKNNVTLVIMHNRGRPKQRLVDSQLYPKGVLADVTAFWNEKVKLAMSRGLERDRIILDPGPDFSKTPAQTIEVLRSAKKLAERSHPLLFAISRKDFIGALTNRSPAERLAGTLATLGYLVANVENPMIFRLHDIREAKDFLTVYETLSSSSPVDSELQLKRSLRYSRL